MALVLCQCSQCIIIQSVNPLTGENVQGKFIARRTRENHLRDDSEGKIQNHSSPPVSNPSRDREKATPSGTKRGAYSTDSLPSEAKRSLSDIQNSVESFRAKASEFLENVPPVIFSPDFSQPLPSKLPQPPLVSNERLLRHREQVNKIMDSLDATPSFNIPEIRAARKAAIAEVLQHLEYLDDHIATAWNSVQERMRHAESSLGAIETAYEEFQEERALFRNGLPRLQFSFNTHPLPTCPPDLPFAANKVFITHRAKVSKNLQSLDSVLSHGIDIVRDKRKAAVEEVLAYISELDVWVTNAWQEVVDGPGETEHFLSIIDDHLRNFHERLARFEAGRPTIRFLARYPDPFPSEPPPPPISLNGIFCVHQEAVGRVAQELESLPSINATVDQRKRTAISEINDHIAKLDDLISDAWVAYVNQKNSQRPQTKHADGGYVVDCEPFFTSTEKLAAMSTGVLVSFLTAIALHLLSGLSRESSNFLLLALEIIITASCTTYVKHCFSRSGIEGVHFEEPVASLNQGKKWSFDIRTAMKDFHLEPDLIHYACCKACFSCYDKTDGKYPTICTFQETPTSNICGAALTERGSNKPLALFPYQPINSFIGRFLCRPGIIEQMEAVSSTWKSKLSNVRDFFGAGAIRTLLGPDCKPFMNGPPGEIRLVFSLFVDWFNPYGNKAAGKKESIGAIYMVCLNLPPHLRYRVENVYLAGLIPGEPQKHHINHVLRPLVSDLLVLWKNGNWFSKTFFHKVGCRVRAAVLLLIADAPAARKVAGFVGIKANDPCYFCTQTKDEFANFDAATWTYRRLDSHIANALNWKNALSEVERQKDWKIHHIRWSELMRLPYWDPTKAVVVDPMHTLFLNIVDHHIRDIWKVDENETHGRKGLAPHTKAEQEENIRICNSAILHHNIGALQKLRRTYLEVFVKENRMDLAPDDRSSVPKLAKAIIKWWSNQPQGATLSIPKASLEPSKDLLKSANPDHILDKNVIGEIRADMDKITLPGWVNRAPRKFGGVSHGKVSADHWRTLCTINLVITLVRLWGHPQATQFKRDLLYNFMALVTIVRFATARTTSEAHVKIVEAQLQEYFLSLVKLPHTLYPSHHMAFHLPQCLRLFGPVHGWWSFPYERYNGIIQRLLHNGKIGDIPLTFMRSFCQGANLRSLFTEKFFSLPILQRFKEAFQAAFGRKEFRGSLVSDLLSAESAELEHATMEVASWSDGETTRLDTSTYSALCQHLNESSATKFSTLSSGNCSESRTLDPHVQDRPMVHVKGVVFATATRSKGNSLVIFRPAVNLPPRAGQIQRIFVHSRPQTSSGEGRTMEFFFMAKEFLPLTAEEAAVDPYRKFPLVDVRLYRQRLASGVFVVRAANIVSHFASYPYNLDGFAEQFQVALSLDRDLIDI